VKDDAESRKPRRPPLTLMQLVALVGVLAALLVVLDFNQRLAAAQRLRAAADHAAAEVAVLETEQASLQTQVAYATTDAAVIEWAHEQGKSVQPGEVLVVPILPTPPPTAAPPPGDSPTPLPNWQLWWNLFFDSAPDAP
jgi:cell division protein FtsB